MAWRRALRSFADGRIAAAAVAAAGVVSHSKQSCICEVDYEDWRRRVDLQQRRAGLVAPSVDSSRRITVYVTGFGSFGKIVDNPTMALVRHLRLRQATLAREGIDLIGLDVVEVSAVAAAAKSTEIAAALDDVEGPTCVLHMGVYAGIKRMQLECRAVNEADFFIPDVRGWTAKKETIVPGESRHVYSSLPVGELLAALHDAKVEAIVSTDAGRYICNYIYYQSLCIGATRGTQVLFLHVPIFEDVPEQEQTRGVEALLTGLRDTLGPGGMAAARQHRELDTVKASTH